MPAEPSKSITSPTFLGLLLAQVTATFNDQAIHMVAIFYASDLLVRYVRLPGIDEKAVISIVTACFILPFLMFSPLAGQFADKYGKRSLIVFWKIAEVAMMGLALLGLSLPHFADELGVPLSTLSVISAVLVASTVFLMGLHSTFFVPAKYGVMPEILHPSVLSRGNGLLEGSTFMAQIFGTSAGGLLYAVLKSQSEPGAYTPAGEWMIGALLFGLALVGTLSAFVMQPVPPAAPEMVVTWHWWPPLRRNLKILLDSRQLTLAVIGIAFCAFMTLFLRQTLLYEAELGKEVRIAESVVDPSIVPAGSSPGRDRLASAEAFWSRIISKRLGDAAQQAELRVALLIALVGFGVGLGSVFAGFLSGSRVELGMVPVATAALVVLMGVLAFLVQSETGVVACLFLLGLAAGPYIVPLYTLLQYRAPKNAKGNVIAACNSLNVAAGILAVIVYFTATALLERIYRPDRSLEGLVRGLDSALTIPRVMYIVLSCSTVITVFVLWWRQPDFFTRALIWLRNLFRRIVVVGADRIPGDGPVILAMDGQNLSDGYQVLAVTDRATQLFISTGDAPANVGVIGLLSGSSAPVAIHGRMTEDDWSRVLQLGEQRLRRNEMIAVSTTDPATSMQVSELIQQWRATYAAAVCPVQIERSASGKIRVEVGPPLPSDDPLVRHPGPVLVA
jgi:acyl-[acyl-carrier-protein]-phospholipid O-acyltransferase/long-chain-fatty-acid--[acyl-carrier-protein] ligase